MSRTHESQSSDDQLAHALIADFERDGFVVVPDAVSPSRLAALRAAMAAGLATQPPAVPRGWLAEHPAAEHPGNVAPVENEMAGAGPHGAASRRYPHAIHWMGQSFLDRVVDNVAVRPLLAAALGPDFVLDHDYAHVLRPAAAGDGSDAEPGRPVTRGVLHSVPHCPPRGGGELLWGGTCNLVTCVYDLEDAAPSDGVR